MSMVGSLVWEVVVSVVSWSDISDISWSVVGRASMGVGEATGVVREIWATFSEAVVSDGKVVSTGV